MSLGRHRFDEGGSGVRLEGLLAGPPPRRKDAAGGMVEGGRHDARSLLPAATTPPDNLLTVCVSLHLDECGRRRGRSFFARIVTVCGFFWVLIGTAPRPRVRPSPRPSSAPPSGGAGADPRTPAGVPEPPPPDPPAQIRAVRRAGAARVALSDPGACLSPGAAFVP